MVPAYDNPVLWEGHGSMIKEIAEELEMPPDAIFCSVGGGGLLGGVMLGCASVGWEKGEVNHGPYWRQANLFACAS
jgi:L-serine/L-threonine ammonia-lyase